MMSYSAIPAAAHFALLSMVPRYGYIVERALGPAKYPAYAYLAFRYARPILPPLLSNPIAHHVVQQPRAYFDRRLVGPRALLSATFSFGLWLACWVVHSLGIASPLYQGYANLVGRLRDVSRFPGFVWSGVWNLVDLVFLHVITLVRRALGTWHRILDYTDHLFAEACSELARALWPCAMVYAMALLFSAHEFAILVYDSSMVSKYPLACLTGIVTLVVLRDVLLKALRLAGLAFSSATHAYAVAISRLILVVPGSMLWMVGLLFGLLVPSIGLLPYGLVLCAKYTILAFLIHGDVLACQFIRPRTSLRRVLKCTFRLLRLCFARVCVAPVRLLVRLGISTACRTTRLLFIGILMPLARLVLSKVFCWASTFCIAGGVVVATVGLVALAVIAFTLVTCLNLLIQPKIHWEATKNSLVLPELGAEPSTSLLEQPLSDSPSSISSPKPEPSEGMRRLALLINVYLDGSAPVEAIEELEAGFGESSSIHAPPTPEVVSPPTPFFSAPTTPILAPSLFLTPVPASQPILAPECTQEDEDEDILSLVSRLSNFSLALDSTQGPVEMQRQFRRSPITFEAYRPLSNPGPVTPPRKQWTYLEWERGAIASLCLGLVAPVNEGLQERNLARVNAGYVVDMLMRK